METYSTLAEKQNYFINSVVINTPRQFDEEFSNLVELSKDTKIHVCPKPNISYTLRCNANCST